MILSPTWRGRGEFLGQVKCLRGRVGNFQASFTVLLQPLKELLTKCADDRHTSIKSLRIKHNERTLFISGIGKKTLEELGIKEDDVLEITIIQSTPTEATSNKQRKQPSPKGKKKKRNNKKKIKRAIRRDQYK